MRPVQFVERIIIAGMGLAGVPPVPVAAFRYIKLAPRLAQFRPVCLRQAVLSFSEPLQVLPDLIEIIPRDIILLLAYPYLEIMIYPGGRKYL